MMSTSKDVRRSGNLRGEINPKTNMHPHTIQTLLELNRRFYHDFGPAFAATRRRLQPGVLRAVQQLPQSGHWLDLGCGSGELARTLALRGFQGRYLGLDDSLELLTEARRDLPAAAGLDIDYRQADLADAGWATGLPSAGWQILTCFAVLHHLPGVDLRTRILRQVRGLLAEGGRLVLSVWQFQNSPRLMERRQPWERAGLHAADLEPGDTLLDWRYALPGQPEQTGLRYVHRFESSELAELAAATGFELVSEYESDGEGGRLGLYQVWKGN